LNFFIHHYLCVSRGCLISGLLNQFLFVDTRFSLIFLSMNEHFERLPLTVLHCLLNMRHPFRSMIPPLLISPPQIMGRRFFQTGADRNSSPPIRGTPVSGVVTLPLGLVNFHIERACCRVGRAGDFFGCRPVMSVRSFGLQRG
jgi:hypothetical protein